MESIFFSSLREKFEGFKETKASTEFSATDPKKMISSARASARRLPREAGIRKAPILNYIDSRYIVLERRGKPRKRPGSEKKF